MFPSQVGNGVVCRSGWALPSPGRGPLVRPVSRRRSCVITRVHRVPGSEADRLDSRFVSGARSAFVALTRTPVQKQAAAGWNTHAKSKGASALVGRAHRSSLHRLETSTSVHNFLAAKQTKEVAAQMYDFDYTRGQFPYAIRAPSREKSSGTSAALGPETGKKSVRLSRREHRDHRRL